MSYSPMVRARYDIFISYSSADAALVQPLADELNRLGYAVFFDVRSIKPGDLWKKRLEGSVRASRTLLLCWSGHARNSEYVTFEHHLAQALHKPIYPWRLDATPLPDMLEIQGITFTDSAEVAAALRPKLGATLAHRRRLQAAFVIVLLIVIGFGIARALRPPAPWDFSGEVIDRQTRIGIPHVEIDVTNGLTSLPPIFTQPDGHFDLWLPQPQPKTLQVRLRKAGYGGDEAVVPTDKPLNTDLTRLP